MNLEGVDLTGALEQAMLDYGMQYYERLMQQWRQQQEEQLPRSILNRELVFGEHA